MTSKPYRVHIVVDPNYGDKLFTLPLGEPAWVVQSKENYDAIQLFWKKHAELTDLNGITAFKIKPTEKPEDWLISELSTIDLHYGEYSHTPPYSFLDVIGVKWSHAIAQALKEYEFTEYEETDEGFITKRKSGQQINQGDGE